MNIFQKNFGLTLKEFGINTKWLASTTGSDGSGLYKYLKGSKDTYSNTLAKWFEALPLEAKASFFAKILGDTIAPSITVSMLLNRMNPEDDNDCKEAAKAMRIIGERFLYPKAQRDDISKSTESQNDKELLRST